MKYIHRHLNTSLISITSIYYILYLAWNHCYVHFNDETSNNTIFQMGCFLLSLVLIIMTLIILSEILSNNIILYGNKIISKHNVYIWKIKNTGNKVKLYLFKYGIVFNSLVESNEWKSTPTQIEIMDTIQNYIDKEDKEIDDVKNLNKNIKYMSEELQNWKGKSNV